MVLLSCSVFMVLIFTNGCVLGLMRVVLPKSKLVIGLEKSVFLKT